MKTLLNIFGWAALFITANTVIYLDKRMNELDYELNQYIKDECDKVLMQNPFHTEGDESNDPDKDVHLN